MTDFLTSYERLLTFQRGAQRVASSLRLVPDFTKDMPFYTMKILDMVHAAGIIQRLTAIPLPHEHPHAKGYFTYAQSLYDTQAMDLDVRSDIRKGTMELYGILEKETTRFDIRREANRAVQTLDAVSHAFGLPADILVTKYGNQLAQAYVTYPFAFGKRSTLSSTVPHQGIEQRLKEALSAIQ